MNRLQCTQNELHEMNAANVEIFLAFAKGEHEGQSQESGVQQMLSQLQSRRG
jgi:hypothetical protein